MPMLCLSYSLATSILSLHQVPSAALTPAYFTFLSLLHIACFLLMQPQAEMIRSTAGTPTTSVQLAPELATPLASVGCPQVRLARLTLQNQLLAILFVRISIDAHRLRCPNACCYYRRRLPQYQITRMKSHPGDYNFNKKNVITWRVAVGGLTICPIPGNKHHSR